MRFRRIEGDAKHFNYLFISQALFFYQPEYQLSLVFARLGDEATAQHHVDLYREKLREMEQTVKALHQNGPAGTKPNARQ